MRPTDSTGTPCWRDVRQACGGLQQAMDAMIEQPEFTSFRPSIARAIAQARDEKQRADHPAPPVPVMMKDDGHDRLEAISVTLAPSDVARILFAAQT